MKIGEYLLEQSPVYRLWQAPFAADKLAPVLAHNDMQRVRRVLDVGCGPGTNTARFAHAEYLGIDINPRYIEFARRKFNREFVVADVTEYHVVPEERFDFILVNSFLHHIDSAAVRRILAHLSGLLSADGAVHILELVLPENRCLARRLAERDRGNYPRPLPEWRALFAESFEIAVFEPYPLKGLGVTLWNMIYCKGRAKANS